MPSSLLLKAGGMYPENPNEKTLKRLKWLNVLRNSVAHSGSIRLDIAESPEASLRVAGAVALLLQDICRIYIAKYLLKIEDFDLSKAQQTVMDFSCMGHTTAKISLPRTTRLTNDG